MQLTSTAENRRRHSHPLVAGRHPRCVAIGVYVLAASAGYAAERDQEPIGDDDADKLLSITRDADGYFTCDAIGKTVNEVETAIGPPSRVNGRYSFYDELGVEISVGNDRVRPQAEVVSVIYRLKGDRVRATELLRGTGISINSTIDDCKALISNSTVSSLTMPAPTGDWVVATDIWGDGRHCRATFYDAQIQFFQVADGVKLTRQ